jgi:circadian clock protein KaiC
MSEDETADDEDDWFERGLSEDTEWEPTESDTEADAVSEGEDVEAATGGDTSGGQPKPGEEPAEGPGDDAADWMETAGESGPASEESDSGGAFEGGGESGFEEAGEGAFGEGAEAESGFDQPEAGEGGEEGPGDRGEAGAGESEAEGAFGEEGGAFEEAGGGGGAFGGSEAGGGSMFDDDFASAFESSGEGDFDEEDFDSEIPRIDLGIEGLDQMIQGGVPQRHLIVTIGSAGTGKTTFGLQFLHHGLQNGEQCVFMTLEQSYEDIMDTAHERGWDFDSYEAEGQLAVIDLDPVEMANSLDNIRGELPGLVEQFDADRLVLDSVSLLEMMYEDQSKRRTEVFDFTRSLKKAGVTIFLTSEASEDNPYASRHGIIEYLTDAVFILQYVRAETREARLAVEILKIRNANHSRETKPYEITMDGISVYQQANIF